MRRGVAARAVVPPAVDAVAAVDAHRLGRQVGQRAAEVAVAEQLDLSLLGPHGHGVRVAGGEGEDPATRRAPARELDGDAQEGLKAELEAAEAPRLQHAEEAGVDVLPVGRVGEAAQRLALGLALAQGVAHGGGARHQLVRVADVRRPDAHLPRGSYAMAPSVQRRVVGSQRLDGARWRGRGVGRAAVDRVDVGLGPRDRLVALHRLRVGRRRGYQRLGRTRCTATAGNAACSDSRPGRPRTNAARTPARSRTTASR